MIAMYDRLEPPVPVLTVVVDCSDCWEPVLPGHECRCECGQLLATHPPLPAVRPWGRRDKVDVSKQRAGGQMTARVQPSIWRKRGRGRKISVRRVSV